MPDLVLPPPAPQSEIEGLRQGYKNLNEGVVPEAGVDVSPHSANGSSPPTRLTDHSARHPTTKRYTNR